MAYSIFSLQGTTAQNNIVLDALKNTTFPWEKLGPKLYATKRKRTIPVEWADLSAYGAAAAAEQAVAPVGHEDHDHAHDDHGGAEEGFGHYDIKLDGDEAHGVAYRNQVLGLAWYSGKVSLDISLQNNPALAKEVFLSEGAHMVDFFFMTDAQRRAIFNAFHGTTTAPAAHGHDWFDKGDYYTWVGEAFMGGFVKAYSPFPVTIAFTHPPTAYVAQRIREILTPPEVVNPPSTGTAGVTDAPTGTFVSAKMSNFFHKDHKGVRPATYYDTVQDALRARKRPCSVCKPTRG